MPLHACCTRLGDDLLEHGGVYGPFREDESHKVIFGDSPLPFSATFEQIEAYVENLEAEEE